MRLMSDNYCFSEEKEGEERKEEESDTVRIQHSGHEGCVKGCG